MFLFSKIALTINGSSITFEGQFTWDDDIRYQLRQFFQALPDAGAQARIDALAARLREQNDALHGAVQSAQQGTTTANQ